MSQPLKNLTEDEQRAFCKAGEHRYGKEIYPWAERLSVVRGELLKLQRAFDRFEDDKQRDFQQLNRALENTSAEVSQLKQENEVNRVRAEDAEAVLVALEQETRKGWKENADRESAG